MQRGHLVILKHYLETLKDQSIHHILDAGSGRTSLSTIIEQYPQAQISAMIYPGDLRKLESIQPIVSQSPQIDILERDLCADRFDKSYDLVVGHLLLGEAAKFGHSYDELLERFLQIKSQYYILIDYEEDPNVDEKAIIKRCDQRQLSILYKSCYKNEQPQVWDDFTGEHNFGYLIQMN